MKFRPAFEVGPPDRVKSARGSLVRLLTEMSWGGNSVRGMIKAMAAIFSEGSRSEDHTLFAERTSEIGLSILAFRLKDRLVDVVTAGEDRAKKSASL